MSKPVKRHRGVYEYPKRSGIWWILYYDQFGIRHREKVGMKSRAINAYQQRKSEIRQGKFEPEEIKRKHLRVSVAEIIDDYVEAKELTHKSIKDTKIRALWWKDHFGDRGAQSIVASDIELARKALSQGKSPSNNRKCVLPGEGRAPATVNRYLAAFKAAYSLAVKNGKVDKNPVKQVDLQREENKRDRSLSYDEEIRLFQVVPKEWHPLVTVALNTGLRKTEQLSLTWEDIDFQKCLIRVSRSKSGRPRYLPMRPIVIETLKSIPRMIDNPFVFYGHVRAERLKDIPKEWESWLEKAGIENFRWHDLRHTFASRLVSSGVSLYVVQVFLGHSSIKVTERYSHLAPGYLQQAINVPEIQTQQPSLQPLAISSVA